MIRRVSERDICQSPEVVEVQKLFDETVGALRLSLERLRSGELGDVREIGRQVGDLRTAYKLILEERVRVAKLRKDEEGIVYDYALDLEAARDEVCRRLACLRDAGCGG
ncbi:hypothetical protein LV82_01339 [Albidovulum inexpectatum]|uniref:Uncharacterized protein n=1 Tax=Albidovulum inexpectatum TaxID=196587 RepID=A0A2S5JIJ3_9RHOB|nr:hypothetical protein [Albidovulum inexpectatum]PPB81293.1 hypothetical protein LV82_01339 [Albidovulum inexpectatum]